MHAFHRCGSQETGRGSEGSETQEGSQDRVLEPVVRQKFAKIRENYKELHLDLDAVWRNFSRYNEGAAYRWKPLCRKRSEDLRRRDELEFPEQLRGLLSGGRELFLA